MNWLRKKPKNFKTVIGNFKSKVWGEYYAAVFYIEPRSVLINQCKDIIWDNIEPDYDIENDREYCPGGWFQIVYTGGEKEIYQIDPDDKMIGYLKLSALKENGQEDSES